MAEDVTQDETLDETLDVDAGETPPASPKAEPVPEMESAPKAEATPKTEAKAETISASAAQRADIRRDPPERLASDTELKELRRINADPQKRRRVKMVCYLVLAGAAIFGLVQYRSSKHEKEYTWPGAYNGNFDDGQLTFKLNGRNAFQMYYPNVPGMEVEQSEDQTYGRVVTKIGRYKECLFRLEFSSQADTNWHERTLAQVFSSWKKSMSNEKDWIFAESFEAVRFFNARHGAGWPYYTGVYRRNTGDPFWWSGRFMLFRDCDRIFVVLREIPSYEEQKGRQLLRSELCFKVSKALSRRHFEVPEKMCKDDPSRVVRFVRSEMSRDFANSEWHDLEQKIKSLLVVGIRSGDKSILRDAEHLWQTYRDEQQLWYNRRCFAYLSAKDDGDEESMRQIRKEALKKFSAWDDVRRRNVLRGIWRK